MHKFNTVSILQSTIYTDTAGKLIWIMDDDHEGLAITTIDKIGIL